MSLATVLPDRFARSFDLYRDFVDLLEEEALKSKLPGLCSNTIGLQLWCVVGARESYARAILKGSWAGYSCSLVESCRKETVIMALRESAETVIGLLDTVGSFDLAQSGLVLDLLEHETAHQGQLIRYLYGLRLPIPASWQKRYHLSSLEAGA